MLENNFDKNVQQEMQGFKIKPSEEVWPKVEERIREKKKRRLFFIIFLIGGLALLGYWQRNYFLPGKKTANVSNEIAGKQADDLTNNTPPHVLPDKKDKENIPVEKNAETKRQEIDNDLKKVPEKIEPFISKNNKKTNSNQTVFIPVVKPETNKYPNPIKEKEEIPAVKNPTEKVFQNDIKNEIKVAIEKQADDKIIAGDKTEQANKIADAPVKEIEPSIDSVKSDSNLTADKKTDSTEIKKNPPEKNNKWKWGVQLTPGVSSLVNNFFSISSNKSLAYSPAQTGAGSSPIAGPSVSKPGFALQAAVFAQRKISSGLQLSIGLQYSYYSDHIRVGGNKDSIFNFSNLSQLLTDASRINSAANPAKTFTNSYHFAELPVTLHVQLNKNSTRPFYLNFGFTAGHMIATNALVYDTAFGGIYFNSKKQFNKTQFSLSTGLLWTLHGKKLQWNIGPVLDIHVSRLLNNAFDTDKYLLMYGLKTRIIFTGKK